jgi:hypothetical protein
MMRFMTEAEELERLETSLWRTETRFDPSYIESVLAADFFEFGRSGRTYSKEATLSLESAEIEADLRDFRVLAVTDDVRLVTYVSVVRSDGPVELANRSSLWSGQDRPGSCGFTKAPRRPDFHVLHELRYTA